MFMLNNLPLRIWNNLLGVPYRLFFLPYYKRIFNSYGENNRWGRRYDLVIPANVKIACPENISIGDNCQFDEYTHLLATPLSQLIIGHNVRFANGFSHVVASFDEIVIENDCLLAAFVLIINGNHGYKDIDYPIKEQAAFSTASIRIRRGSWIVEEPACWVVGVALVRNVIVGDNAVVTKSVPDYCVVPGNPVVIVKRYKQSANHWESPPYLPAPN